MILHLLKIILKGSRSSGNFGHLGRPGVRGGSGPGMNGIASQYTSILRQVGKDLNIDDVRKFKSMSFDQQMELATKDRVEFDRLKEVTDNFKKFKFSDSDPVTTLLSPTNAKLILNRMSDPVLSQKELSKSPTKDNYQSWFYQKYGVVAENLSGSNAKRYGEALDAIDERHGVVGGFFIKGVDTAWQRAGERGGEFDSAYGVIRVPTRLQGGGQDQDAKDVLNHEYAHYLDAYVLGSPNITTKQLKGSGGNILSMKKDDKQDWLTSKQAGSLGYVEGDRPGYVKYESDSKWSRDPSKVKRTGYKDHTPHELLAKMFEDHMANRLDKAEYSEFELDWFNKEVLPKL